MWDVGYSEQSARVTGPTQTSLMTMALITGTQTSVTKLTAAGAGKEMVCLEVSSVCLFHLNPHCISSVSPRKSSGFL